MCACFVKSRLLKKVDQDEFGVCAASVGERGKSGGAAEGALCWLRGERRQENFFWEMCIHTYLHWLVPPVPIIGQNFSQIDP